jgi:hypothetical protein
MICVVGAVVAGQNDTKQKKSATNTFEPATIDIALKETVSTVDNVNGEEVSTGTDNTLTQNLVWTAETEKKEKYNAIKQVTVTNSNNENNTDAYIRVCIIPKWISTVEVPKVNYDGSYVLNDDGEVATETKTVDVQTHYGELSDFGSLTDINLSNGTSPSSASDGSSSKTPENDETSSSSNEEPSSDTQENDETSSSSNEESSSDTAAESSSDTTETNKSTNTYTMGAVTFTLANDWFENWIFNPKDGYFYYKTKVAPGEETAMLLEKVSIDASTKGAMDSAGVSLQVDVIADSIQTNTDANAIYKRWGDAEMLGITVGEDGTLSLTD